MDRGAWWATAHGVARVGHDLATKPPTAPCQGPRPQPCVRIQDNRGGYPGSRAPRGITGASAVTGYGGPTSPLTQPCLPLFFPPSTYRCGWRGTPQYTFHACKPPGLRLLSREAAYWLIAFSSSFQVGGGWELADLLCVITKAASSMAWLGVSENRAPGNPWDHWQWWAASGDSWCWGISSCVTCYPAPNATFCLVSLHQIFHCKSLKDALWFCRGTLSEAQLCHLPTVSSCLGPKRWGFKDEPSGPGGRLRGPGRAGAAGRATQRGSGGAGKKKKGWAHLTEQLWSQADAVYHTGKGQCLYAQIS